MLQESLNEFAQRMFPDSLRHKPELVRGDSTNWECAIKIQSGLSNDDPLYQFLESQFYTGGKNTQVREASLFPGRQLVSCFLIFKDKDSLEGIFFFLKILLVDIQKYWGLLF